MKLPRFRRKNVYILYLVILLLSEHLLRIYSFPILHLMCVLVCVCYYLNGDTNNSKENRVDKVWNLKIYSSCIVSIFF